MSKHCVRYTCIWSISVFQAHFKHNSKRIPNRISVGVGILFSRFQMAKCREINNTSNAEMWGSIISCITLGKLPLWASKEDWKFQLVQTCKMPLWLTVVFCAIIYPNKFSNSQDDPICKSCYELVDSSALRWQLHFLPMEQSTIWHHKKLLSQVNMYQNAWKCKSAVEGVLFRMHASAESSFVILQSNSMEMEPQILYKRELHLDGPWCMYAF